MPKNLIQIEREASLEYMLEIFVSEVTGDKLVNLTPDNVARAEAMFHTDSNYSDASDPENEESSAYSIDQLRKYLERNKKKPEEYKKLIADIVERLDKENSTHLNSDKVGREEITERITEISKNKLLEYLKRPMETDFKLIDIISEKTKPKDKKHRGRINLSFASKFCHYMCLILFEGRKEQDNYPIYDSVIRENLPKYIKHYGLKPEKRNLKDYKVYRKTIDEVIKKAGGGISRNGFDHLVWYYFKGKSMETEK